MSIEPRLEPVSGPRRAALLGRIAQWWPFALLAILAVIAYRNSFSVPFLFDDFDAIVYNPHVHHLWPLWYVGDQSVRPLTDLSFAANYVAHGLEVEGYHVVNLAIHWLAAVTLLAVVRRTLRLESLRPRFGNAATWLATVIAALWLVHPLQTESVTYLAQRAESLMGLWYVLTLYAVIRGAQAPRPERWYGAAVVACGLGMATKSVMVSAPLVVFLYDGAFLAGSWHAAWTRRRSCYLGMAATWGIVIALSLGVVDALAWSLGFQLKTITPGQYLITQPGVILHYLRLALWPDRLVFDYQWLPQTMAALPSLALVGGALALTVVAWRRWRGAAFLAACWWLLLAPTSSVFPLADLAAEHRLYLALAPLLSGLVLGAWNLASGRRLAQWLFVIVAIGSMASLTAATIQRNYDYRNEVALWEDTVAKRPSSLRARVQLCSALVEQHRYVEAISRCQDVVRRQPENVGSLVNLGIALDGIGLEAEAFSLLARALSIQPFYMEAHVAAGNCLLDAGRLDEATVHFVEAVRLDSQDADALANLGLALARQGRWADAAEWYRKALWCRPRDAQVHQQLAVALERQGRFAEAAVQQDIAQELRGRGSLRHPEFLDEF